MKLIIFGDSHQNLEAVKAIMGQKADLYVCHGDLSDRGQGLREAGKILGPLKEKLWLLPGNNETEEQAKSLCQQYGFFSFHQQMVKKDDLMLVGFGYSPPTPFETPGEISEEEFKKGLAKFSHQKNLCLFTHSPPQETELDLIGSGAHVGSQAIKDFIIQEQPLYSFSGHIHENAGKIQRIGRAACFNIGQQGLSIWL